MYKYTHTRAIRKQAQPEKHAADGQPGADDSNDSSVQSRTERGTASTKFAFTFLEYQRVPVQLMT